MNDYPLWLRAAAQMLREHDPTLRGVANTCDGAADEIATLQRELGAARADDDLKAGMYQTQIQQNQLLADEVARLQSQLESFQK